MEPNDLAARLLDAQVEFLLAELSGDRFAVTLAGAVDEALAVGATVVVAEVVDADQLKQSLRWIVDKIGGSALSPDITARLSEAIYDLPANESYTLGEVVDRELVAALVTKLVTTNTLHDRTLDRLSDSPAVAAVASRFVASIVGGMVQKHRLRAEKLPGVGSLWSLGTSAASRMRDASDRYLDPLFSDASAKGTQFAMDETSDAIREVIGDARLQDAAMDMWDMHATEPVGALRQYLSRQDLHEFVLIMRDILTSAYNTEYGGQVLDTCVDVFLERYGNHDIASVLSELGVGRKDILAAIEWVVPPIIEAAKANGALAAHIRNHLEPFFHSETVTSLLAPARAAEEDRMNPPGLDIPGHPVG